MKLYLQAEWRGPGVYALVVFGSTEPPNSIPVGTWKRAANDWDEARKYNTLASTELGLRTCFARQSSDLQTTED